MGAAAPRRPPGHDGADPLSAAVPCFASGSQRSSPQHFVLRQAFQFRHLPMRSGINNCVRDNPYKTRIGRRTIFIVEGPFMNVCVITGLPGCGKTSLILDEIASTPGRYLFAMPRTDLIEERVRDLQDRASTVGTNLVALPIHSDQKAKGQVRRRIRLAAEECRG